MKMDEHERYATFQRNLGSSTHKNTGILSGDITGALEEPDHAARAAMLGLIANFPTLGEPQLQFLADHVAFSQPFLQKILARRRLVVALDREGLSDTLFKTCLALRDDVVHRKLLSMPSLSHAQLLELSEIGANKAVRNIAKDRSGRSKMGPN